MIYVDLVAILNFMVDFLLLLGTNRLSGFPPDYSRVLYGAAIGGIYGGACLHPSLSFLGNILWRFVFLVFIIAASFGINSSALRRGCIFLLLSMALGGMATGFGRTGAVLLVAAAFLIWMLCRFGFSGAVGAREYIPVTLRWEDRELTVIALKDTGNTLSDPLTGEQVLVAGADVAERLLGLSEHHLLHPIDTIASGIISGSRLIPYHAVGQPGSMMLAVRFHDAKIGNKKVRPLVAFAPQVLARGQIYQMLTGGVS